MVPLERGPIIPFAEGRPSEEYNRHAFCVFCTCGLGELECILDSNLNTILIFSTKDFGLALLVSDMSLGSIVHLLCGAGQG